MIVYKQSTQLLLAILISISLSMAQETKEDVIKQLDQKSNTYSKAAKQIWEWAEVGYKEEKSSALIQTMLKDEGFEVVPGIADIPTAFVASYGSGSPVIALLAEFDALPGLSQKATPYQEPLRPEGAGHACGHHLLGVGSSAAAIAIKKWMIGTGTKGTIKLYGCPAEEGGAGKVYMVRAGLFNDVDIVLHWHPAPVNVVPPAPISLANITAKFRFHGKPSHAAGSPHKGRSALDGVEAMNVMVNMMREHIKEKSRIHYIITKGGDAPNVVPGFAEAYYYVRDPHVEEVKALFNRIVKAAEGAALGTETKMEYEIVSGVYNLLPNEPLSKLIHDNLSKVGGVSYGSDEKDFANELMKSYGGDHKIEKAAEILPFVKDDKTGGSTDVGDVSWLVPTGGFFAATWVPGTSAHSWQAVAAGGTDIGMKGMMVAAKTLSLTAMDIFENPSIVKNAHVEFNQRKSDSFVYEALLGDRNPPLDYRE